MDRASIVTDTQECTGSLLVLLTSFEGVLLNRVDRRLCHVQANKYHKFRGIQIYENTIKV
jgi:hypothetical protein